MCEAKAYLITGDEKILVMEAVDRVEPEDNGLRIRSIFGEQKFFKARIRSLSMDDHTILIAPVE